jgi:hypothetical protein
LIISNKNQIVNEYKGIYDLIQLYLKSKFTHMLRIFILLVGVIIPQLSLAQSFTGFWEVKEVKVGEKITTPVAKWTRINPNGTYQAGNGWLQNSEGTWRYDEEKKLFRPVETNGIVDTYGAFRISFVPDTMIWKRDEDGMPVVVKWIKISELPKSTAELLVGIWDLEDVVRNNKSEKATVDPDDIQYTFIRWDRIYVERTAKGEKGGGYWHINGHKPEVTLISYDESKKREIWNVSVNDHSLTMVGISESNKDVKFMYKRLNTFPD